MAPPRKARRTATSAVAPPRLALALSAALVLVMALVWTGCVRWSAAASVPVAAPRAPAPGAQTTKEQVEAAKRFAGSKGKISRSNVLVTHPDGKLVWIVLCVGEKPDRSTALIDAKGEVYEDGIDDFRAHNDLLGKDDRITFNRDIASASRGKHVKLITRSAHTASDSNRTPWLIGGGAVAVVVLAGGVLLLVRRARRKAAQADAA